LILWGNEIEEIEGLEKMGGLEYLILSKNKIKKIKNLENCPLKYFDISDNPLESESKEEIIKLEKRGVYVRK
jgi:Leucine-rich repeat (LRR) protein